MRPVAGQTPTRASALPAAMHMAVLLYIHVRPKPVLQVACSPRALPTSGVVFVTVPKLHIHSII